MKRKRAPNNDQIRFSNCTFYHVVGVEFAVVVVMRVAQRTAGQEGGFLAFWRAGVGGEFYF